MKVAIPSFVSQSPQWPCRVKVTIANVCLSECRTPSWTSLLDESGHSQRQVLPLRVRNSLVIDAEMVAIVNVCHSECSHWWMNSGYRCRMHGLVDEMVAIVNDCLSECRMTLVDESGHSESQVLHLKFCKLSISCKWYISIVWQL